MDIETLKAISEIVGGLTTQAVLLYWVYTERQRFEALFGALMDDWQRQREREIDKQAQKANNNGQGI